MFKVNSEKMAFVVYEWQRFCDSHRNENGRSIVLAGLWDLHFVSFSDFPIVSCSVIQLKWNCIKCNQELILNSRKPIQMVGDERKIIKDFVKQSTNKIQWWKRSFVFWLSMIIEAKKDGINDGIVLHLVVLSL